MVGGHEAQQIGSGKERAQVLTGGWGRRMKDSANRQAGRLVKLEAVCERAEPPPAS